MRFGFEPAQDVGLQHVLQNGLGIIKGQDLGQPRRDQVLEGLLEIVSDADRGAGALGAHSLNFALDARPALERFSLFLRYLHEDADQLSAKLTAAKGVLERLRANQIVGEDERSSVEHLLSSLLMAIEQERSLMSMHSPQEIHYQ